MRRLLALIALVLIAAGGAAFWWLHQPLVTGGEPLELAIEPGTTPRGIARDVVAAGARVDARMLYAWFRFSGQDRAIKAGNYEIPPGTTPRGLLQKLVRGEESLRTLTLVDGQRFTPTSYWGVTSINVIPHTQQVTTLRNVGAGDKVNIEIDTIARYVERMLSTSR